MIRTYLKNWANSLIQFRINVQALYLVYRKEFITGGVIALTVINLISIFSFMLIEKERMSTGRKLIFDVSVKAFAIGYDSAIMNLDDRDKPFKLFKEKVYIGYYKWSRPMMTVLDEFHNEEVINKVDPNLVRMMNAAPNVNSSEGEGYSINDSQEVAPAEEEPSK